jgi:hypothetical protein
MSTTKHSARRAAASVAVVGLLMAIGCGDETGLGKRYSVTGVVTYHGERVKQGTITFKPAGEGGREATGAIHDGDYSLSTAGGDDGALPGRYRVAILAQESDTSAIAAHAKGGAGRQDDVYKAAKAAKRLVPSKYQLADTSGLEAEVKEQTNKIDFPLTD